ncbi:MAG: hypothetical protein HRT88_07375 [Lentisphaeraceae bacterium]|nr:hypothetical protein [Lentisphaeraceae bacterium]
MLGENQTVAVLSKMMELSTTRQKVIASNLANATTPGYIRKELDFESELRKFVINGDLSGLKQLKGEVVSDETHTPKNDGNNVRISEEMNEMSQNGILFSLMQKALKTKVSIIKSAIR